MKVWKIGIAGCGNLAETVYIPQMAMLENAKITAVFSRSAERAEAVAEKFGIGEWYDDLDTFLEKSGVDIVLSVGAIQGRHEQNMKILQAGKHLYSQKPFAPGAEEALRQIEEAERRGLVISTAPVHRNRPDIRRAKEWLDRGLIGHPSLFKIDMNHGGPEYFQFRDGDPTWYYRKGAGALLDIGIHGIDQAVAFLGPAKYVSCTAAVSEPRRMVRSGSMDGRIIETDELPDNYIISLDFGGGTLAVILAGFIAKENSHKCGEIEIYGDRGTIVVEGGIAYSGVAPVHLFVDNREAGLRGWIDQQPTGTPFETEYFHVSCIADLIDAIENGHPSRLAPEHSRHVLEIIDAIPRAFETGAKVELKTTF